MTGLQKEMAGNSLVTIASRFRNCDPDLHSDYIRFGDPVVVEEFNGRMRDDYASVVDEVKKLCGSLSGFGSKWKMVGSGVDGVG